MAFQLLSMIAVGRKAAVSCDSAAIFRLRSRFSNLVGPPVTRVVFFLSALQFLFVYVNLTCQGVGRDELRLGGGGANRVPSDRKVEKLKQKNFRAEKMFV